jgi:hypothetical protein
VLAVLMPRSTLPDQLNSRLQQNRFERTVTFALDDDLAVIAERMRETIEE